MALELSARLDTQSAEEVHPRNLDAVVEELALGSCFLDARHRRRTIRLQQLELAAVVRESKRRRMRRTPHRDGTIDVRRQEAGVPDFTVRRRVALRNAACSEEPPPQRSTRAFEARRRSELQPIAPEISFEH